MPRGIPARHLYADIRLVLQYITEEEVSTRLLNNYERQGYVSLGIKF